MDKAKSEELLRVAKFGGTSLADSENIKKAAELVKGEDPRRYVVVSAPGKRFKEDVKITDMLYSAYDSEGEAQEKILDGIESRFRQIVENLGVCIDINNIFKEIRQFFQLKRGRDYAASRGEYLMALIFSVYTGYEFVDAAEVIFFSEDGTLNSEKTNEKLKERLEKTELAVIPGFYGSMPGDTIKTFSRGGSDITGALVARAVNADVYENFTDVDGFMMADPRIVDCPKIMEQVTYDQLRELSYMGATVLHEDSIYPVRFSGIPINIKNTFNSEGSGTVIVSRSDKRTADITGIAGKKGFCTLVIDLNMSDRSNSNIYRIATEVFHELGVEVEHIPGGIDSISFVLNSESLKGVRQRLLLSLCRKLSPECVHIEDRLALIAIVGDGVSRGGRVFDMLSSLSSSGIPILLMIRPPMQSNIIVGVDEQDYENALKELYSLASKL